MRLGYTTQRTRGSDRRDGLRGVEIGQKDEQSEIETNSKHRGNRNGNKRER